MSQHKVFLITGNAGQGKTTIARNLGYALRNFGYDVLIIDGDSKTPKLHHHIGIAIPKRTIQDVLLRKRTFRTAFYKDKAGIKYLLSSMREMDTAHPSRILNRVKDLAEIVLIDAATNDQKWYETGTEALLVTQADFPSVLQAHKQGKKANAKSIILNRIHNDMTEMSANNIKEFLGKSVVGSIPESRELHEASHLGNSIIQTRPQHTASTAIKKLAANLMNLEYKPHLQKPFLAKLRL